MSINIHMHIIRNQQFIEKDILNGYSNPKWFDELQLNSCNRDYEKFPVKSGIPKVVPEQIINDYNSGNNYYRFYYITIKDFLDWCDKVNPWLKAGWATTYQKWQYENKVLHQELHGIPQYRPASSVLLLCGSLKCHLFFGIPTGLLHIRTVSSK